MRVSVCLSHRRMREWRLINCFRQSVPPSLRRHRRRASKLPAPAYCGAPARPPFAPPVERWLRRPEPRATVTWPSHVMTSSLHVAAAVTLWVATHTHTHTHTVNVDLSRSRIFHCGRRCVLSYFVDGRAQNVHFCCILCTLLTKTLRRLSSTICVSVRVLDGLFHSW